MIALLSKHLCDPCDVTSKSHNIMSQSDDVICQTTAMCIVTPLKESYHRNSANMANELNWDLKGPGAFKVARLDGE